MQYSCLIVILTCSTSLRRRQWYVYQAPYALSIIRVQEVLRIGGVYFGLIALAMFFPSGSKKKSDKLAAAPAPVPSSSGDVPSVEAPEFGDWISVPGNAEKFF